MNERTISATIGVGRPFLAVRMAGARETRDAALDSIAGDACP